jgi:hypothetical protein
MKINVVRLHIDHGWNFFYTQCVASHTMKGIATPRKIVRPTRKKNGRRWLSTRISTVWKFKLESHADPNGNKLNS